MHDKRQKRVVVRRSREGMGLGLFAAESIAKGDYVISYTGEVISAQEAERRHTRYIFACDENYCIDGSARTNTARYMNHFCVPNVEADIEAGEIRFYARRNIQIGEELGYDYGEEHFQDFIAPRGCKCVTCST